MHAVIQKHQQRCNQTLWAGPISACESWPISADLAVWGGGALKRLITHTEGERYENNNLQLISDVILRLAYED